MPHTHTRTLAMTLATGLAALFAGNEGHAQEAVSPPAAAAAQAQMPPAPAQAPAQPSAPAAPAPAPDPADAALRRLDRDGNGTVSAQEHAADAKARFDAVDADNNYHVSAQEMEDARARAAGSADTGTMGAALPAADPNDNGELSTSEADANAQREFRALDANGDGTLERSELERAATP
jgi:hypothetical protein